MVVALLLLGGVLTVSGCGTRLPASAFSQAPAAPQNVFVDGVSATQIKVGMIDSITSPVGADAFSGPGYGARAFFNALNAAGGVDGRKIVVDQCDDSGSGLGNKQCVNKLIDQDRVFAFAGNSIFDYAGAAYVSSHDVPDIGGQPIDNAYNQYPHLYGIYGSSDPRQGTVGWNGRLYGGTEVYEYFKQQLGAHVAAVVAYNQPDSVRFAQYTADGLRAVGYAVVSEQIDFALPNFAAIASDMKGRGVQVVFDAIDTSGNARLCAAIDQVGLGLVAKVTTVQSWDQTVPATYSAAPRCRNVLYATASDRNYQDTKYPAVAAFRVAMQKYFPDRRDRLSMWELEGWISAQWLTDAVASCGAAVSRGCVERFMNRPETYDAHGLIIPTDFVVSRPGPTQNGCLNVARWQDSAYGGKGGWVTQVPDMDTNCFVGPVISYKP
ncbi:ABC transporter substrate-binding protein [Actinocrinis puniceicyclus]|uniref:ABC transporter substrate-binding protein n=1 Tax=Actinocrinis puniceicyclus TaxID=977794 RepID=A0A8J8B9W6_9ACTN|nr:ABC transporter substrate-binding protein [Actinocrinis puniceicyclus]